MKAYINCFLILSIALFGCSDNGVSYQVKMESKYGLDSNSSSEVYFYKDSTYVSILRNIGGYDSMFKSGKWEGKLEDEGIVLLIPKNVKESTYTLRIRNGYLVNRIGN